MPAPECVTGQAVTRLPDTGEISLPLTMAGFIAAVNVVFWLVTGLLIWRDKPR